MFGYTAMESPFNEAEEMELATQLLDVADEAELDQFLELLFEKAKRKKGKRRGLSRIARPLGGILKGVVKQALPMVGGALGSLIPIPGVGTALGSTLGSALSQALEAELVGMSPEDQEFETARRIVRLAGTAAQQAAAAPPTADPQATAQAAVTTAAQQDAPGLLGAMPTSSAMAGQRGHSGRWIRRGRKILLLGV
jgi:hypothetical protein